ncbi:MAG: class I SAM-dependent methyltransferase [Thermoleophilaceae bacterium]
MLARLYHATWGRAFAWGFDRFQAASEDAGMREHRRRLVAAASGRTLELGAGTGANVELYPEAVTELVLTEPFGPMAARLRERVLRAGRDDAVVEVGAEQLPFAADSFDTVVVTLVLCTVEDPAAALDEIARVLRPGGSFLFLEHVRSSDPKLARRQDRLHRPWHLFAHGCNCNRDTLAAIESSPLLGAVTSRSAVPKAPALVRPLLEGVAHAPR